MKLSAKRFFIEFDYEFLDGEVKKFRYYEPTTQQIEASLDLKETKEQINYIKKLLKEQIKGDGVEKLINEQIKEANIFDFKQKLDEELGKKKKG